MQRTVVVTGSAVGIGAAIAEELGRTGAFVVTLDPSVSVDGTSRITDTGPTTAERILAAGGRARASNASVTDFDAVSALFNGLVDEFGALDAVVNVAGISRATGFGAGAEADWAAVVSVHLQGYLNVLRAALPLMAEAGHGRILGVTSGSGWRHANAGAYSVAKRAVAALTWQIGRVAPAGVTVNALSPIALTRMVTGGTGRSAPPATEPERPTGNGATGGLSLAFSAMPAPENLGPIGAYLASEQFAWSSGNIIFSSGAEAAYVAAPHLLEVVRTTDTVSLPSVLDAVVTRAFIPAEVAQGTNGGNNPRFAGVFDERGEAAAAPRDGATCLVVGHHAAWNVSVTKALEARGVRCLDGRVTDRNIADADAVVLVAMADGAAAGRAAEATWQDVLAQHTGVVEALVADAAWINAVAGQAAVRGKPARVVVLTSEVSAGGHTHGQALAQLSRAAHLVPEPSVDVFVVRVGDLSDESRHAVSELTAHLVCTPGTGELSGAEFVTGPGWLALASHPSPRGSITFGGPEVPEWFDGALKRLVTGHPL
ncbi:MAG: SDR family NAD(P)-dependent oxidoreductase [Acidimicrobiia bacterium]